MPIGIGAGMGAGLSAAVGKMSAGGAGAAGAGILSKIGSAGSLIGGLGSLASGVSGFFGSSKKTPDWDNWKKQLRYDTLSKRRYAKEFKDYAKAMGVSRHALLGTNFPSGSSVSGSVGSSDNGIRGIGEALSRMGQDVGRGVQTYMAHKDLQSTLRLRESQARYYDALAVNAINSTTQNAPVSTPSTPDDIKVVPQEIKAGTKSVPGIGAGTRSAQTIWRGDDDYVRIKPSDELAEILESQGITEDVKDIWSDINRTYDYMIDKGFRERIRRAVTRDMLKSGKLRRNEMLVWSHMRQMFKVVPIGGTKLVPAHRRRRRGYPSGPAPYNQVEY